jgi:hypothetical protein
MVFCKISDTIILPKGKLEWITFLIKFSTINYQNRFIHCQVPCTWTGRYGWRDFNSCVWTDGKDIFQ